MGWVSLTVDISEADSNHAQALVHAHGASGLEVRDGDQLPMPQVRAPVPGGAIIVAYFDERAKAHAAAASIRAWRPDAPVELDEVRERDWSVEWRSQIRSVTVGRLWVGPPWERPEAPTDKRCLFIEPKMAFGTGDHPTTRLCLAAVDDFVARHPGASVLDVGTGTGVLALAARLLGSGRVVGTDNDPVAISLARECAAENGIEGVELSTATLSEVHGPFDLVVANILANTLVELAPLLAPLVGRRLVLAGVLAPQADEVRAAYTRLGLQPLADTLDGEWVRLELERRA